MRNTIGVLFCGCGCYDGTDIHEAVLTLYCLDRAGAAAQCMAPDVLQHHVRDHLTQQLDERPRNALAESARIVRGAIQDVGAVRASDIDGLIIPGGFGTVTHLSDFAVSGPECGLLPAVERLMTAMRAASKPVGATGIAAATIVRAMAGGSPQVTIGRDAGIAAGIVRLGGIHRDCGVTDIVVDASHRIVTTPAYMLDATITEVARGIGQLVDKVLELCPSKDGRSG